MFVLPDAFSKSIFEKIVHDLVQSVPITPRAETGHWYGVLPYY